MDRNCVRYTLSRLCASYWLYGVSVNPSSSRSLESHYFLLHRRNILGVVTCFSESLMEMSDFHTRHSLR